MANERDDHLLDVFYIEILRSKILNQGMDNHYPIPSLDVYAVPSPQLLPFNRCRPTDKQEWLFYSLKRDDEFTIRTRYGFYEITDHEALYDHLNNLLGYKRTLEYTGEDTDLLFHRTATGWKITEYGVNTAPFEANDSLTRLRAENFVLCKVTKQTIDDKGVSYNPFNADDISLVGNCLLSAIMGWSTHGDIVPTFDIYSAAYPGHLPFFLCQNAHGRNEGFFFCYRRTTKPDVIINTELGFYELCDIHRVDLNSTVGGSIVLGFIHTRKFFFGNHQKGRMETSWIVEECMLDSRVLESFNFTIYDDYYTRELISNFVLCKVFLDCEEEEEEEVEDDDDIDDDH